MVRQFLHAYIVLQDNTRKTEGSDGHFKVRVVCGNYVKGHFK